jgi:lysophospholipase L1-like esterase
VIRVVQRRRRCNVGKLVTLVSVFALLAVGCGSDHGSATPTTADTTSSAPHQSTITTTTSGSTLAPGDKYVALGSSIASGFGISVQSTSCGRSNRDYPQLVASRYRLALTDVTCGAATIPNVVDTPQGDNPPQLQSVTADTRLVTVSVGGNDIGYNGTAVSCGDPATVCTAPATLQSKLAILPTALGSMIAKIRAAAPSATIAFVTYPREVPDGNCPALGFSDEEATVVRSMGEQLESIFVKVMKTEDAVFVDPYVAPGDHTGCATPDQRWTSGKVPDDGFAYHPTALGHQIMAQMIAHELGT